MDKPSQEYDAEDRDPVVGPTKPHWLGVLGPGLITGASDDDPSGIATYSQVGAAFGYGLSWTLLFSYPLMVAIQMISARIGRTTGHGIAGVLRMHYSTWLLQWIVALLLIANIVNLGADLGAMADALALFVCVFRRTGGGACQLEPTRQQHALAASGLDLGVSHCGRGGVWHHDQPLPVLLAIR
jgi:Natural resistance-associated macrophage protein